MKYTHHDKNGDLSIPLTQRLKEATLELIKQKDHIARVEEMLKLTQKLLEESQQKNDLLERLTSNCSWNDQCPVKNAMKK